MPATAEPQLKSELARWSLGSNRPRPSRRLAWANSTCLLFLVIGVVGARTRTPIPKVPVPLEEAAPIIIEAPPPAPPDAAKPPEQAEPDKTPAPVVVVVPNAPSVSFSVPTVGTLVAPSALAQAPPAETLRESAPAAGPALVGNTGQFGDRREPKYPPLALSQHIQGTVTLLITADADGNIISVDVKESSGSGILDRGAKDFVTLHWKMAKGQGAQQFLAPITYLLTQ